MATALRQPAGCFLPLTNSDAVVLVDPEDYARFSQYRWRLRASGAERLLYVVRQHRRVIYQLRREILGVDESQRIRFRNGDRFDYRRENLEAWTPSGNPTFGAHVFSSFFCRTCQQYESKDSPHYAAAAARKVLGGRAVPSFLGDASDDAITEAIRLVVEEQIAVAQARAEREAARVARREAIRVEREERAEVRAERRRNREAAQVARREARVARDAERAQREARWNKLFRKRTPDEIEALRADRERDLNSRQPRRMGKGPSGMQERHAKWAAIAEIRTAVPSLSDYSNARLDIAKAIAMLTTPERLAIEQWAANHDYNQDTFEFAMQRVRVFTMTGEMPPADDVPVDAPDNKQCAHLRVHTFDRRHPLGVEPAYREITAFRDCYAEQDEDGDWHVAGEVLAITEPLPRSSTREQNAEDRLERDRIRRAAGR